MRIERGQIADSTDLLHVSRSAIKEGLQVRVRLDDVELVLLFLDRLAVRRSDWLPAVGDVVVELLCSGDLQETTAAADLLANGRCAPALLPWLEEAMNRGATAHASVENPRLTGETPHTLEDIRSNLADFLVKIRAPERRLVFSNTPVRVLHFHGVDDLWHAIEETITVGKPRVDHAFDPCVLGWLRYQAYFVPWVQAELVPVIERLCRGDDERGWWCAVEYFSRSGDLRLVVDVLRGLVEDVPVWWQRPAEPTPLTWVEGPQASGGPLKLPPLEHEDATFGDHVQSALAIAEEQARTGPVLNG